MNEFSELVLTEDGIGQKRVFILPEFTYINPGDIVAEEIEDGEKRYKVLASLVAEEIEDGEKRYKVLASCTLRNDDEKSNFIMKLCEPVKAYKIYRAAVMDYNEQEGKTDE
ncbi:MAG: hypothetical protein IIW48_11350 [Clostridia bacterium]|nr:hypothetical protein [Clostridia bacterium]